MEIKFSRHAKRRIKLYDLSELKIKEIITKKLEKHRETDDKVVLLYEGIKIILKIEKKEIVVVTAYPFNKKV